MPGMETNALKKTAPYCYNECTFNVRGVIIYLDSDLRRYGNICFRSLFKNQLTYFF